MTDPIAFPMIPPIDDRPLVQELFRNLKARLPELEKLADRLQDHWTLEDGAYRYYHQSWKVFDLQDETLAVVAALQGLLPSRPLNAWFANIVAEGTGKTFKPEDNKNWCATTRPILEACFHAKYFLEMAVKYSKSLPAPPTLLPSGYAALLCLYDLR